MKNEKGDRSKKDALYCAVFRRRMAIEWPKKRTKRARQLPKSTAFIATSKMNKVEKVTECNTAENSQQANARRHIGFELVDHAETDSPQ